MTMSGAPASTCWSLVIKTLTIRPLISEAIAALNAKIRASWVRGRRSMVNTTSAQSTTAATIVVLAISFPRRVTPELIWIVSRQPEQPQTEGYRAAESHQHDQGSRELLENPGPLQHGSREEGEDHARQGAHHPGGEVGAQNVSGGGAVAAGEGDEQGACEQSGLSGSGSIHAG